MEGPYLPEGSGGEEPPEELSLDVLACTKAYVEYHRRMSAFKDVVGLRELPVAKRARRRMHDYTTKNCEEAFGEGRGGGSSSDRLG